MVVLYSSHLGFIMHFFFSVFIFLMRNDIVYRFTDNNTTSYNYKLQQDVFTFKLCDFKTENSLFTVTL